MKKFTLNGKEYNAREIGISEICEMEEMGCPIMQGAKSPLNAIRVYVAMCLGVSPEMAAKEIENHILNDGDLDEIVEVFTYMRDNSGFFRKLQEKLEKETQQREAETKKKSK